MSDALYSARHLGFRIIPMSWSTTGIVLEANSMWSSAGLGNPAGMRVSKKVTEELQA